jgi:hypothetical protein
MATRIQLTRLQAAAHSIISSLSDADVMKKNYFFGGSRVASVRAANVERKKKFQAMSMPEKRETFIAVVATKFAAFLDVNKKLAHKSFYQFFRLLSLLPESLFRRMLNFSPHRDSAS